MIAHPSQPEPVAQASIDQRYLLCRELPGDRTNRTARLNNPSGISVDGSGIFYVADTSNNTIRKGYPALAISNTLYSATAQFSFNLTGPTGQFVVVETSTDLVNWLSIWTNTFAGPLNFSDPQSGVYSNRFYRDHSP